MENPTENPNPNQAQGGSQWNWRTFIFQMIMLHLLFNYFLRPKENSSTPQTSFKLSSIFKSDCQFEFFTQLSENEILSEPNENEFIWKEENLFLNWSETNHRSKSLQIPITDHLLSNKSMYLHIWIKKETKNEKVGIDPPDLPSATFHKTFELTKLLPVARESKKVNLLSAKTDSNEEQIESKEYIAMHWKPNITLNYVVDLSSYVAGSSVPAQIADYMNFADEYQYYPIVFSNEFWILRENFIEINDTLTELPLNLHFEPISFFKFQFVTSMNQHLSMQESMGLSQGDPDEFKRVLMDTNPYFLGLTIFVSLLHTIFDFLAFSNDITFWKNKKSMEGLSVRSLFLNTFCQIVIFLYLFDNEASWLVVISCGVGILIEFWKLQKAVIVKVDWNKWIPVTFTDRESYTKSKTKEYDAIAMKYLSYALYPLAILYAIYSLVYETHKSWYSWIISSLTGFVYTFGFVMMCPQLFINYKMKSVAHLPWKTFMYKALNTVIDDLFAFIIKMPTMHRLSCFRDDIIFLIYLYQRWIYPVDYSRQNEFGQGGAEEASKKEDQ